MAWLDPFSGNEKESKKPGLHCTSQVSMLGVFPYPSSPLHEYFRSRPPSHA